MPRRYFGFKPLSNSLKVWAMTKEEFESYVKEYRPKLVSFAQDKVGDRDRAEDSVQDALLDLIPKYPDIEPTPEKSVFLKFRWFVRICIWRYWRKEYRIKSPFILDVTQISMQQDEEDGEHTGSQKELVDPCTKIDPVGYEKRERCRAVKIALETLPQDVKQAIWEHFGFGVSWEIVGKSLGLPASMVEPLTRPGVAQLRKQLKEWEPSSRK